MARHTAARTLHDLGLAAWFGGSLMGAVGLNGATAGLRDPQERATASTAGWSRWAPVNAVAVGAHLVGAVRMLRADRSRVRHQKGVALSSAVKTALTAGAVGTTAYSAVLNRRMAAAGSTPVQGATEPGTGTPSEVARTQEQLRAVQWLIPALTGGLVVATAWQGEQQRTSEVVPGLLRGTLGQLPSSLVPLAATGAAAALLLRSRSGSSAGTSGGPGVYPVGSADGSSASGSPATPARHSGSAAASTAQTAASDPTL